MQTEATPRTVKPTLRGWQHAAMFPIAVVAGTALVVTAPTTAGRISSAIFAATATLLFGMSALLHLGGWAPNVESILRRLDHANIYLIIAGTYTPFAVLALPPDEGKVLLTIVWTGALIGVAMRLFWIGTPRWLSTTLYVVVGWIVVLFVPDLIEGAGAGVVVLVALGGILYTIGAIVYATKWPNPFLRTYGFHEVFHTLTVAAFAAHYIAVWIVVHQ